MKINIRDDNKIVGLGDIVKYEDAYHMVVRHARNPKIGLLNLEVGQVYYHWEHLCEANVTLNKGRIHMLIKHADIVISDRRAEE